MTRSKGSSAFFLAFGAVCVVVPWVVGEATMRATQLNEQKLQEELRKRGRADALAVGQANKERLGQFLQEIERKENTEDRYAAALRGETLTGTPDARIRGGGTSQLSQGGPSSPAATAQTQKLPVV